jgi:hypothetical protein
MAPYGPIELVLRAGKQSWALADENGTLRVSHAPSHPAIHEARRPHKQAGFAAAMQIHEFVNCVVVNPDDRYGMPT